MYISPGVHKKVQTETTNLVEEGTQTIEFWSAAETIFNSTAIEDPGITDDEITMDDSIDNSFVPDEESFIDNRFVPGDTNSCTASIIFWSALALLLQRCTECGRNATILQKIYNGSMLCVKIVCNVGHSVIWRSQPLVQGIAEGNLRLAAAVLFSGNTFSRMSSICSFAGIRFIAEKTYCRYQKDYLFGVVNEAWLTWREKIYIALTR